ncbi:MAG: hypothetical protein FWD78_12295 [Treponema sp.]|nr:hypothetical protein [Treponema sp.]
MKKLILSIYIVFFGVFSIFAIGEKTLSIGKLNGWNNIETRQQIIEVSDIRPSPVLALSSAQDLASSQDLAAALDPDTVNPDMHLTFDEGSPDRFRDSAGHYEVIVPAAAASQASVLQAAGGSLARKGSGAARFIASGYLSNMAGQTPLIVRPYTGALFSSGKNSPGTSFVGTSSPETSFQGTGIRDFTIEFWLCPSNPENGEQIVSWSSTVTGLPGVSSRRIQCSIVKNRLQWTFTNFFVDAGGQVPLNAAVFTLTGIPLIPKTYSHHLIRYNSSYGLLEYLVNGRQEAIVYTTSTAREGGEVYTPAVGSDSNFVFGSGFTGLIDEFIIYPRYIEKPDLTKYSAAGGRAETKALDLGPGQANLVKLDVSGGGITNYSEMRFYIRFGNNPYKWETSWIRVQPGVDFPDSYTGRYAQIAIEFFPSGDCESSPYLEELRLVYRSISSPKPPSMVTALARDGAVDLSWRQVADPALGGYLVYLGTCSGEYYSETFSSPIDAGNRTSMSIGGLKNGTLYFFAVASYDKEFREPGEFSGETAARPQKEW